MKYIGLASNEAAPGGYFLKARLLSTGSVLASIALVAGWVVIGGHKACDKKPDMRYYPRVRSAAYPTPDSARLITLEGDLLTTDDGGRTWITVSGKDFGFFERTSFVGKLHGWANSRTKNVLRTSDGGASWIVITRLSENRVSLLGDIGFIDSAHGWMVSPSALWLTENGGATWRSSVLPEDATRPVYFCRFLDADKGWLSGSGGAFYRTVSGGQSWEFQRLGTGKQDLREVTFLNSTFGWTFSATPPEVFITIDGGESWRASRPIGASGVLSASFVNRDEGWILASLQETSHEPGALPPNTLLHTTNSGRTWENAGVWQAEPNMNKVHFVNSSIGWLLGTNTVYRTEDGGKTWAAVLTVVKDHKSEAPK